MVSITPHLVGINAVKEIPFKIISYSDAERDAKELAARLTAAYGERELRRFEYAAIPRGGLFVLGMLSYILDLYHVQLRTHGTDVPLVVVDDCSLSGARFAQFLAMLGNREVIFAHLWSHPKLRAQILDNEPSVTACFSARDLGEVAQKGLVTQKDRDAWLARNKLRWHGHPLSKRYWSGWPHVPIFPWSEPDHSYWNPYSEAIEDEWRLIAPDRCLKNWARLRLPPKSSVHPAVRSPDGIAFNVSEGSVLLCQLSTEKIYGFEGVAAEMWRALAAYGDVQVVLDHLLSEFTVDEETVQADLHAFVNDLLSHGLLEPTALD